ncbi:hypothetical protein EHEL_061350 [Encephalitozoon hellem ATCC 50504]|uniref:uncharacterized protein n=1 Tax=Encephalitozoon hellem (strain ATCC 50504) TaxID=907965 RepID=UPI00026D3656|nr:uncharacterized protein EHEL_061350 [Encephalitozoon hellem ATCC 50504]AFM98504.1 hypothetical protein EHEL_061350 [Encephalitozoon hellem ATCC 50504]|eukprot:XP_003887485.1 hypothetical protein EHEL_061350 [Encephalitozoon hellem ATCC 50504]
MDELISELRSTQARKESQTGSTVNGNDLPASSIVSRGFSSEMPPDPFAQEGFEKISEDEDTKDDVHELTSSQVPTSFHIMKLDFDVLSRVKKENQVDADINKIKGSKKYKIENLFAGIIKKLNVFGADTACLELVDESGSICGSCPLSVVDEFGLKVGTIVLLSKCSLWKINGNHLNIVASNINKVI